MGDPGKGVANQSVYCLGWLAGWLTGTQAQAARALGMHESRYGTAGKNEVPGPTVRPIVVKYVVVDV
uniref:Putative secreted protein n=1 Tax=Anopheles triannulatus TaxID=58253 RepID=A0A2M4B7D8_9DIPT